MDYQKLHETFSEKKNRSEVFTEQLKVMHDDGTASIFIGYAINLPADTVDAIAQKLCAETHQLFKKQLSS